MSKAYHHDGHGGQTAVETIAIPAFRTKRRDEGALNSRFGGTWSGRLTFAILLVATPVTASVIVSRPVNDSTVTSPVRYSATSKTATCARGVAAMGVYVDNKLIYVVPEDKLSVQLSFKVGKYETVVEEWDKCGGATYTKRIITVVSNSSHPPVHSVEIRWDAPESSPVPVVGFNVYRSPSGSSTYHLLNLSIDTETSYVDSTVRSGHSYDYVVESVDASGVESPPTSPVEVTIP